MKSLYNSVIKNYKLLIILVIFVLGIYYYANSYQVLENMENKESECPNMLIEKDGEIYLFNSKKPLKDNENPIKFNNLEDYAKFVKLQKDNNIECASLVLQYTTDTQNNDLIQIKSSIFENDGGVSPMTKDVDADTDTDTEKKKKNEYYERNKILDATLDSTPNSDIKFNTNMYSGFDSHNQSVGLDTPLDKLYHEKSKSSANPMDPHWGGKKFTKTKVESGEYRDRYIYKHPK